MGKMVWNPINFFRRKEKREEEINKILGDLETLRTGTVKVVKATPGAARKFVEQHPRAVGGVAAAGIAAGTAAAPFVPAMAPAYAKSSAESELFHIAERVTAEKYREAEAKGEVPKTNEVMDAITKEIEKQFGKKRYNMEWFADEKGRALGRSLIAQGIRSGREQIRYYEREWGGRYPGQAVQKLEQAGAATSYVARKAGLYGKVRNTATQMERLDPEVRSAINKARLELQKKSRAIKEEFDRETVRIKSESQPIETELKRLRDALEKTNREINEELTKEESPGGQQAEGGALGGLGG